MTYDYAIDDKYTYDRKSQSDFSCIFSGEEYEMLVNECKEIFHRDFTNEVCVRLDGCKKTDDGAKLSISTVRFYDFLLTNFAYFNRDTIMNASNKYAASFKRLFDKVIDDGGVDSFNSIIEKNYLSNILAVSCLLTDGKSVLMTKRNGNLGISNNFYSTTVTGSVDGYDYNEEDPIFSCCIREFGEEMNGVISSKQMSLKSIVCGKNKIQPIALVDVYVDDLNEISEQAKRYGGFFNESSSLSICEYDEIRHFLEEDNAKITEAARTHLERVVYEE